MIGAAAARDAVLGPAGVIDRRQTAEPFSIVTVTVSSNTRVENNGDDQITYRSNALRLLLLAGETESEDRVDTADTAIEANRRRRRKPSTIERTLSYGCTIIIITIIIRTSNRHQCCTITINH